jgi:hypothetical protein
MDYMVTHNHPLSYSGPEIKAMLTPRNDVNAPIHLMLTETTTVEYRGTHSRYCGRRVVAEINSCVKIFQARSSTFDTISPATVAYLDRLRRTICICCRAVN